MSASTVESPTSSSSHETDGTDRALAILRERFARGEIDGDEFTELRDTLQSGN